VDTLGEGLVGQRCVALERIEDLEVGGVKGHLYDLIILNWRDFA
jgi:hypothetical protein